MSAWRLVVVALGLWLGAVCAQAEEPRSLAEAERLLEAVQFDLARDAAHRAIDGGGLSSAQLARAYEIIGLCAATVGSSAEAQAAYLRLLALRPDAAPSDTLSPEKNRPFYEAQGFWLARTERLRLSVQGDGDTVRATVEDPLQMAAAVRYEEPARPEARAVLPLGGVLTFRASEPGPFSLQLLDARGNVLAEQRGERAPPAAPVVPAVTLPVADRAPPPPPPAQQPTRLRRSPWLWGAVGVVVAGGVTALVLATRERDADVRTDLTLAR